MFIFFPLSSPSIVPNNDRYDTGATQTDTDVPSYKLFPMPDLHHSQPS